MYRSVAVVMALLVALNCAAAAKSTGPVHVPLPPSNPLTNNQQEKQQQSKPAMTLFSKTQLASLGRAMAIGYYPRGCLQGGIELPTTGADLAGDANIS
jgi:murein endopeptidase